MKPDLVPRDLPSLDEHEYETDLPRGHYPADVDTLPAVVAAALAENVLYHVDFEASTGYNDDEVRTVRPADECNVVTSQLKPNGLHRILLDLDIPAALIPSSTPGHSHLYLDTRCTKTQLEDVLTALTQAGVIEGGYGSASIARGHTALRIPGIKKAKGTPANE